MKESKMVGNVMEVVMFLVYSFCLVVITVMIQKGVSDTQWKNRLVKSGCAHYEITQDGKPIWVFDHETPENVALIPVIGPETETIYE